MPRLALIGGGGFAKEVADVAELTGFDITAYFADEPGRVQYEHRGNIEALLKHRGDFDGVALAIGAVNRRTLAVRRRILDWLRTHEFHCPVLASPHAVVSKSAKLGPGTYVAHNAVIQVDVQIGAFALINTAAQIGHDCRIGDNVNVSSLAFLGGGCQVGDDTLIGASARVLQGARLGNDALVGLGCTVLRRVADHATVLPKL